MGIFLIVSLMQVVGSVRSERTGDTHYIIESNIMSAEEAAMSCKNNYGCQPTLCCSEEKCVQPSKCLEGKKLYQDYCDFNFECLTSCCNSNKCSPFVQCYEKCMTNSDCKNTTTCCSQGYCTDKKICLNGGKIKGEYCDLNSECKPKLYCLNNQCVES